MKVQETRSRMCSRNEVRNCSVQRIELKNKKSQYGWNILNETDSTEDEIGERGISSHIRPRIVWLEVRNGSLRIARSSRIRLNQIYIMVRYTSAL